MKKDKHIKRYSPAELKASRTDLSRFDATTEAELERLVAEDEDERGLRPDWTQAQLVLPRAKQSVHLRIEKEVLALFKSQGKGHISRMQAVLKAYVEAHRQQGK